MYHFYERSRVAVKTSAGDTELIGIAHIGAPAHVLTASYAANQRIQDRRRGAVSEQLLDRHTTLQEIGLKRAV